MDEISNLTSCMDKKKDNYLKKQTCLCFYSHIYFIISFHKRFCPLFPNATLDIVFYGPEPWLSQKDKTLQRTPD